MSINAAPITRIRIVAGTGVWVRELTFRNSWWAGNRESRAMAKACREQAAIITMPAPNIANVMPVSRIRSVTGPS